MNFRTPLQSSKLGWSSMELAKKYFHNSEHQRQAAFRALFKYHLNLNESLNVLDYGCGDGKLTAIFSRFGSQRTIGVDVSPSMINLASNRFCRELHPNLEFFLDESMTCSQAAQLFERQMNLVTSMFVFHLVEDIPATLVNVKKLLKPQGKFIGVIPLHSHPKFMEVCSKVLEREGLTVQSSKQASEGITVEKMKAYLLEAGFQTDSSVEKVESYDVMYGADELVDFCVGTLGANWNIPFSESPRIFEEIVNQFVQQVPEASFVPTEEASSGLRCIKYFSSQIQFCGNC